MSQPASEPTTVRVVAAQPGDVDAAAALLAAAFVDDPTWAALLSTHADEREPRLREVFTAEMHVHGFEHTDLALDSTSGDLLGVAVWAPPVGTVGVATRLRWSVRSALALGLAGLRSSARYESAAARDRPAAPHWHLLDIAAGPTARGRGVGGSLLAHRLAVADAEGRSASLEATTQGSRRLYGRHGFRVAGQLPDELGGAWTMVREPGAPAVPDRS